MNWYKLELMAYKPGAIKDSELKKRLKVLDKRKELIQAKIDKNKELKCITLSLQKRQEKSTAIH